MDKWKYKWKRYGCQSCFEFLSKAAKKCVYNAILAQVLTCLNRQVKVFIKHNS